MLKPRIAVQYLKRKRVCVGSEFFQQAILTRKDNQLRISCAFLLSKEGKREHVIDCCKASLDKYKKSPCH